MALDTYLDQALYLKFSFRTYEHGKATVVPDILEKKAKTLCNISVLKNTKMEIALRLYL